MSKKYNLSADKLIRNDLFTNIFDEYVDIDSENPFCIPDWKQEDLYPKADETAEIIWRWEFLRRNKCYQKIWLAYQDNKPTWNRLRIDGSSRANHVAGRFGLTTMVTPRYKMTKHLHQIFSVTTLFRVTPSFSNVDEFIDESHKLGRYLISVTPDLNLGRQLEQAKKEIELWNQEYTIKYSNARSRSDKFAYYLRLLDARAAKPPPSWSEITAQLALEGDGSIGGMHDSTDQRSHQRAHAKACEISKIGLGVF